MKHILKFLNSLGSPVYEHKVLAKLGIATSELDGIVSVGFAKRITVPHRENPMIQITKEGKTELARLEAEPIPVPPKSATQLRVEELETKFKDNTVTVDEVKEYLKLRFIR